MTKELTIPENVQNIYNQEAGAGMDGLEGGSFPVLRQHMAGSVKNERLDGAKIPVGDFFHTGTKESYHDPLATLLYIKKCQLPAYESDENEPTRELKSNYVVAGILQENNQPFILYVKGLSYNKMWPLQDELKPLKKQFPLYAFTVKLVASEDRDMNRKFAAQPVTTFELVKDEKTKQPVIETDLSKVENYRKLREQAQEGVDELIYQTLFKKGFIHEAVSYRPVVEVPPTTQEALPALGQPVEDVNDQIPF